MTNEEKAKTLERIGHQTDTIRRLLLDAQEAAREASGHMAKGRADYATWHITGLGSYLQFAKTELAQAIEAWEEVSR